MTYDLNEPVDRPEHDALKPREPEPTDDRVDLEVGCITCGYNLYGASLSGTCPECGTEVDRSVRGDLIGYADPPWVATLAKGLLWAGIASLGGILVMCLSGVAGGVIGAMGAQSGNNPADQIHVAQIISTLISFIPLAALLYGVWLFTTPEPEQMFTDASRRKTSRVVTRVALVAAVVAAVIGFIVTVISSEAGEVTGIIGALPGQVMLFAMLIYALSLARRIPDMGLAKQTVVVLWGLAASYGVMLLALVVIVSGFALTGVNSSTPAPMMAASIAGGCTMLIASVGLLVFAVWSIVLIFLYHGKLKAIAEAGEPE